VITCSNHLSHALFTFPVFAFVGFEEKPIRPMAVEDVVRILAASLVVAPCRGKPSP
jgi:Cu/Ag efflux pump CusA